MRRVTRHAVVLVLALAIPLASAGADDEAAVRQVFDSYKSAILEDDGGAAASLLSAATVDYYAAMRELALYATEDEIRGLASMDMLSALRVRDALAADRLLAMSGRDLLVYAVDEGWVGKESVASLSITAVNVDGDNAVADALTEQGPYPGAFEFRREADSWKLDLLKVMRSGNDAFDELARQQGMTREDFVLSLLAQVIGKPVDPAIWQPPLQRP